MLALEILSDKLFFACKGLNFLPFPGMKKQGMDFGVLSKADLQEVPTILSEESAKGG